jgi:signal transduction histidine kinase
VNPYPRQWRRHPTRGEGENVQSVLHHQAARRRGTGLGLSISHDIIVKQHGGKIDVETKPGVITEFIITLPR